MRNERRQEECIRNSSIRRRISICLVLIIVLASFTGNAFAVAQAPSSVTLHIFKFWDGKERVPVIYDPNGGPGVVEVVPVIAGSDYEVLNPGYEWQDVYLLEWNTKKNGNGTAYKNTYKNGDIIRSVKEQVTLYAQWGSVTTGTHIMYPNSIAVSFDENTYDNIPGDIVERGVVVEFSNYYTPDSKILETFIKNRELPPDDQSITERNHVYKAKFVDGTKPFKCIIMTSSLGLMMGEAFHYAAYVINDAGEVFYGNIKLEWTN